MDIELHHILGVSFGAIGMVLLTFLLTKRAADRKIEEYSTLSEALSKKTSECNLVSKEIEEAKDNFRQLKKDFEQLDEETAALKVLKLREETIESDIGSKSSELLHIETGILGQQEVLNTKNDLLHELQSKLDLYSRIDEFIEYGHFETPQYLYETSQRFAEEIKAIREKQRNLIRNKSAVEYPNDPLISDNKTQNKRILEGQAKLMLTALSVESDLLISKVSPSNYSRTLERIEKLANSIEKSAATLHSGFNIDLAHN